MKTVKVYAKKGNPQPSSLPRCIHFFFLKTKKEKESTEREKVQRLDSDGQQNDRTWKTYTCLLFSAAAAVFFA